jgi:hypothetical protein
MADASPLPPHSFRRRARQNVGMAESRDPVDAVADELYGLPPEEFTAARNVRAKEATGTAAAQIKALRKPAVAAWAVNLLVRDGQLAQAVELSAALRDAQDDLDAKELTQLGRQRRQLVASLARRAGDLARDNGTELSPSVRDAVSNTINAAVMDAAAAAAVLTGRLVKPLDAGGLEGMDVSDLVGGSAPDGTPPAPRASRDDLAERRKRKAAEEAARAAEAAASAAQRDLQRVEARQEKAQQDADSLHLRVEELRAELDRASKDAAEADADAERLAEDRDAARARAAAATRDAEGARAAVSTATKRD